MSVRESAQFIAANSQHVFVVEDKCESIAQKLKTDLIKKNYSTQSWSAHPLNPSSSDVGVVDWIFTIDTLNFSFWSDQSDDRRFSVEYKGTTYTGYWSLVAAINRALDDGIKITSPSFWVSQDFTIDVLASVFRSSTDEQIPLLNQRYEVLVEAGRALKRMGFDSFEPVVRLADHSAMRLLDLVTSNFKSYNDVFTYKGRQVAIFKRAQILIGDLWGCFNGDGLGRFDDIDEITMFADYRVPQILWELGLIKYSPELENIIRRGEMIESGSQYEVELRGCSVWAVEVLRKYIPEANAVLLDFYLWDTAKEQEKQATIPCHRTRSVFY